MRDRVARLRKLKYNESDILDMCLAPELMSSEDSDGVCHPPSYRNPQLTQLFKHKVDVVKLRSKDMVKERWDMSVKNIPSCLLRNPNVIGSWFCINYYSCECRTSCWCWLPWLLVIMWCIEWFFKVQDNFIFCKAAVLAYMFNIEFYTVRYNSFKKLKS